jgi:hypothetical protein
MRIQFNMTAFIFSFPARRSFLPFAVLFAAVSQLSLSAQENAAGPLAPPPDHNVRRIVGVEPEAPPSLPPAEIIQRFAQKEQLYLSARPAFAYRKSIRIQEFGPDGRPAGEFNATYDGVRSGDGKLYEKAIAAPESTLQNLQLEPDDVSKVTHLPAYALVPTQLSKYNLQFLSTEKVDEIDCYIFQVSPKVLDRQNALFDGIVWVDQKFLEIVKTYGQWVTDLGPLHPQTLPFSMFETYRENVEGKYWFPNYSRSEGTYKLQDRNVPIRITIKWTNYKPFPPAASPAQSTPPQNAPTQPPANAPSTPAAIPQPTAPPANPKP